MPPRTPKRAAPTLAAVVVLCGLAFSAGAADKKKNDEPEVDYVALAAKLIADGHYDRAERMLAQVDLQQEELDLKRFYTLQGLTRLKRGAFAEATDSLQQAVKAGQNDPVVYLYLAQGYYGQKDYQKTIEALDRAGPAGKESPAAFGMRAQAHWELEQPGAALAALVEGERRFPDDHKLTRTKIFHLVELGLFQEVLAASGGYLSRAGVVEDDYLAIGEALRRGGQPEQAQAILEQARLRFPRSERTAVQLAHAYVDDQQPVTAAMLFEAASRRDPKFALEAAELYKEAGRAALSLSLNSRVVDQPSKMKQRLSILLGLERYDMIAGMEPTLSRLGLLTDDDIRYALAYAHFKAGDFDRSEALLGQIRDSGLFRAGIQLRKAMASCRDAAWECF